MKKTYVTPLEELKILKKEMKELEKKHKKLKITHQLSERRAKVLRKKHREEVALSIETKNGQTYESKINE